MAAPNGSARGIAPTRFREPPEARIEIRRRATPDESILADTAQDSADHLAATTNRADASGVTTQMTPPPAQHARTSAAPGADLTAGEREVLQLLVAGLSTAAIAAARFVPPRIVSDHFQSIMTKLGAASRLEIVAISLGDNILGAPRGKQPHRRNAARSK